MLMVLSSVLAKVMAPIAEAPGSRPGINLDTLIPKKFEGWKLESSNLGMIVNPEVRGELNDIYNQTLSRAYVNKQGDHIMLSIAYGGVQKTDMHAHRPEICYAASGFDIGEMTKTFVDTTVGKIPVMQLVAKQGARNEPITYWIRVGDSLTRGWIEQKMTAMGYGLAGKVPDGLLVRVSSISNDDQGSYLVQKDFLAAMLKAVRSDERFWLVGRPNS
jgi:EpsI family protein